MSPTPSDPGSEPTRALEPRLKISEIFDSIQGEGPSAGLPCTFLRLAGCNLSCTWCDTRYSWDWSRYTYSSYVSAKTVGELAARFVGSERLVITGGEPLLQQRRIEQLLEALPKELPIEIETNGTVVPLDSLLVRVTQWNVSPKLANSGESLARRDIRPALLALRDTSRAWLKFVVGEPSHADQAMTWARELEWPHDQIQLMPLAATRAELERSLPLVEHLCEQHSVRLSPRLHVERWNGRRGV
jgi:organic radical activating enzyme